MGRGTLAVCVNIYPAMKGRGLHINLGPCLKGSGPAKGGGGGGGGGEEGGRGEGGRGRGGVVFVI